ncbi:MAG: hypothetical protein PHO75_02455 [Candidatus Shapirobacteria bacterium]|jgi:hypothetical protein|nr:hypothetical protein [Candidatus Shapirobacteria bacterium]
MQVHLKKYKISLSETPQRDVPAALLILNKKMQTSFIDVVKDKQTYVLPDGMNYKEVESIYLRVL